MAKQSKFGPVGAFLTVFSNARYLAGLVLASAAFLLAYVLVPVKLVPGGTLGLYLAQTPRWELATLVLLSVGLGSLLCMQVFVWRRLGRHSVRESAGGAAAWASSIASGVGASASCGVCLTALFSFLGSGGILFLMGHQWQILCASLLLMLGSLYFISRRINNECGDCKVKTLPK